MIEPDRDARVDSGAPRWVKIFAVVALVAILLVGALLVFGGGEHGPGRHIGSNAEPAYQGEAHAPGRHTGSPGEPG